MCTSFIASSNKRGCEYSEFFQNLVADQAASHHPGVYFAALLRWLVLAIVSAVFITVIIGVTILAWPVA